MAITRLDFWRRKTNEDGHYWEMLEAGFNRRFSETSRTVLVLEVAPFIRDRYSGNILQLKDCAVVLLGERCSLLHKTYLLDEPGGVPIL